MKTEHAYTDAVQRREEEVREHISWFREFLTFGTELPETIRRQYGLEEDYRRYMELAERDNRMFEEADGTEYRRYMEKIRKGEIPVRERLMGKWCLQWKRHTSASVPLRQGTIWRRNIGNCCF